MAYDRTRISLLPIDATAALLHFSIPHDRIIIYREMLTSQQEHVESMNLVHYHIRPRDLEDFHSHVLRAQIRLSLDTTLI